MQPLNVFTPAAGGAYAMPFGATVLPGDQGVLFRLWAPADVEVDLLVAEGGAPSPETVVAAQRSSDGWREAVVPQARAGTRYQWRIGGELRVPDPASRSNPDGVHAPSRVVDPSSFTWDSGDGDGGWAGRPWSEVVLYELHVGTFTPEGTFAAAQGRLQALADLGVTAIELMPLADFPGRFGWGYDGVLPFAPHAAYGSPDDLKALVQAAHRLGLMVFLDVVYNHFGPEGNYLHAYAPAFFSKTHTNPWGASLNFDGPDSAVVRRFFIDNALYWLSEYRFDGLRLDAIHAIVDDSPEHVVHALGRTVRETLPDRHVHLVLENENNGGHFLNSGSSGGVLGSDRTAPFDAQWNDDFHHAMHVLLTGETAGYYGDYADRPVALVARSLANGFLWEGTPRDAAGTRAAPQPAAPQPLGAMVNYLTNHDQSGNRAFGERISQLMPREALPVATAVALLSPATPMLFFGDEFAATTPFLYFADWQGDLKQAVTEGRMREFAHLNAQAHGSGAAQTLPPPCEASTFEASRLDWRDAASEASQAWQAFVARALAVRRQWIVAHANGLQHGSHSFDVSSQGQAQALRVRWRYQGGQVLELQANLGPQPCDALPGTGPALQDAHTVFDVGTLDDLRWAAWSARWVWGREDTSQTS